MAQPHAVDPDGAGLSHYRNHHQYGDSTMTNTPFTADSAGSERAKQGNARMREIAQEMRHQVEIVSAIMIQGAEERLGRPVTPHERLVAEAIAGCFLKARKYRDQSKVELELEFLRLGASIESQSIYRQPVGTGDAR
jgi:hypothetical protein